jgi:ATP-binding cassette subfamily F protein uup
MDLITLRDIELGFGGDPLLEGVSLAVARGERVCLLGRNGAGKTSLLKVLTGALEPDGGEIIRPPGIRIADLPQSVPDGIRGDTQSTVAAGFVDGEGDGEAWDREQRIERTLSRLSLDPAAPFEGLSGGLQRRVLLARALVAEGIVERMARWLALHDPRSTAPRAYRDTHRRARARGCHFLARELCQLLAPPRGTPGGGGK